MLQLRRLHFAERNGQIESFMKPIEPAVFFIDIDEAISKIEPTLKLISPEERTNIYCTVGHIADSVPEGKKLLPWSKQDTLFFDIDQINFKRVGEYNEILEKALKTSLKHLTIIFSGHGLHVLMKLKKPITTEKFFKDFKPQYDAICENINSLLKEKSLDGHADPVVFCKEKYFRFPGTINKKKDLQPQEVRLLNKGLEVVDFDLVEVSGLALLDNKAVVSEKELSHRKIDGAAVLAGCEFLKHTKANQTSVSEPEWYASLGILAHLPEPEKLAVQWSERHPGFSEHHTLLKLRQAKASSGPRLCESIDKLWKKCGNCQFYKKPGITSPIAIRSPEFISTEHSGFHMPGPRGALIPQHEDLRLFYEKSNLFINVKHNHYLWNNTHWEAKDDVHLESFAQDHFFPICDNKKASEFRGLIKRKYNKPVDFFANCLGKINLKNGVLDLKTMTLEPHSPKYGFKNTLPFDYDPEAACPKFDIFMNNITCGDETLKENLLEFTGYALANEYPYAQKLLLLVGEGANGKSTFIEIITALGGDGVQSLTVEDMANTFHVQMLDGALFNISEETPAYTKKSAWEKIKALTTGSKVTASKKQKDPYTFTNRAKLIMTCNELPAGPSLNYGFFRRLLLVPFNATFSHEAGNLDPAVAHRIIEAELPGVLNLALRAYQRLKERGYKFSESKAMEETLAGYRIDIDGVARWLEDNIEVGDENESLIVRSLYEKYQREAKELGETYCHQNTFAKRLVRFRNEKCDSSCNLLGGTVPVKEGGTLVRRLYGVREISGVDA